jgi:rRNA maturation endonuclease Nob1
MATFKGGRVADDQADIERRVLATMERTYHCIYCHSVWREGANGRCKSCGSGEKVCNSCHTDKIKTHTRSSGGTNSGGPR